MNRKQRKAKQQRANQHRKVAKTVEYKRKQSNAQLIYINFLERHIHDLTEQRLEIMNAYTDPDWPEIVICFSVVFGGLFAFHLLVSAFFEASST